MGEIVNLNKARKARDKAAALRQAAENRARHGRSAGAKAAEAVQRARRDAALDGASIAAPHRRRSLLFRCSPQHRSRP
jgi:hypothetical protein